MIMRYLTLTLILLFNVTITFTQNSTWINYTNGQTITSILEINENELWIGTNGGLVRFNKVSGSKTFFNKANSGLPGNNITCLTYDNQQLYPAFPLLI